MPPIEVGLPRAIGAVTADITRKAGSKTGGAATGATSVASAQTARPTLATSDALDAGPVPVDTDRVAEIRKAVESGTYPLLPAKIADAMIAAGMILRSART